MAECVRVIDGTSSGWRRSRNSKLDHAIAAAPSAREDESFQSDYGKKFLEKFGWSHGQGLGAAKEGRTEPLLLSRRSDSMGLGADQMKASEWSSWWEDLYNSNATKLAQKTASDSNSNDEQLFEDKSFRDMSGADLLRLCREK